MNITADDIIAQIPAVVEKLAERIEIAGHSRRFAINRVETFQKATFRKVSDNEIIGYAADEEAVTRIFDCASDAAGHDYLSGHIFRIDNRTAKLLLECGCGEH